ncbi:putative polygalacturonase [Canna indica]|uniref:Polygalacturonase n=1 Tax=Canna indica TaxID=4628 RepID=A0AAQ3QB27_9LILI|nr:putative polygalacturonase [Canna indica]
MSFLQALAAAAAVLWILPQCRAIEEVTTCAGIVPMRWRREVISIADFGAVGDGKTLNTWSFHKAIYRIQHLRKRGGTLLYIPAGVWLTGSFNLTSHMTLYLAKGAVIKATQDVWSWPLVDPLPSYGRGRELPGSRYMSLIQGNGIRDVVITGENGTIDGQGDVWWNMWRQKNLLHTRPNLLELINSRDIIVSNVVFLNSPFWNIHPVYCNNMVVKHVTVLAPYDSPNTDGVDPASEIGGKTILWKSFDSLNMFFSSIFSNFIASNFADSFGIPCMHDSDSSSNVCIEDSYISTGDDLVAVKSGWDEYGIAYGRPSSGITIRRLTGSSPFSGIAIGSETSGGVENVLVENVNLYNIGIGVHIKTNIGRGGYIRNITISDVTMNGVGKAIRISGHVGDHPDDNFNPRAIPTVDGVTIKNVWGEEVEQPGSIEGIKDSPFTRICLSNVKLWGVGVSPWRCTDVSGAALGVNPWPCPQLASSFAMNNC